MEEYENVLTLRDETIVQALSTLREYAAGDGTK